MLNILEGYNLSSLGFSIDAIHWMVESWKYAFSDYRVLGDPSFVDMSLPTALMNSKKHAAKLRENLFPNKTFPPDHYIDLTSSPIMPYDAGTTHISVVDANRTGVAYTTTMVEPWGSKWISNATGIILNNAVESFTNPNSSNPYNLPISKSNYIQGGKFPLSNMAPTVVLKDGRLHLVVGVAGGKHIPTTVSQILLNMIDFHMSLNDASDAPRLHHSLIPNVLLAERSYNSSIIEGLRSEGHEIQYVGTGGQAISLANVVQIDGDTLVGKSDKRATNIAGPAGY